jgi:nicotinamidase-related amidase
MSTRELLTPDNCTVIFIDHQPQMTFGVTSRDRQILTNNVVGPAKGAKVFQVPVVLATVETKSFSGSMWPQADRKLAFLIRDDSEHTWTFHADTS